MPIGTKDARFFVSHKLYRLRWPAPKTGYQLALQTFFVVVGEAKLHYPELKLSMMSLESGFCFIFRYHSDLMKP
jgi:hypothetical protein